MKFPRTRKFYVLVSFGFVIILFFFSHWRSYNILVHQNKNAHRTDYIVVQDTDVNLKQNSDRNKEIIDEKCRSENGLQTSVHCVNKGDFKNIAI